MQLSKEKKNQIFMSRIYNSAHAFMQLDYSFGTGSYPQIQLLDELHEIYPSSTFIINFRPIQDWIRSISNWKSMRTRMAIMDMPGLQLNKEQLENKVQRRFNFYNGRGEYNLKQAYAILVMNETLSSNKTLDTTLMTHNEIRMYDHAKMLLQRPNRKAIVLRAALKAVTVAEAAAISNNTTNDDGDGMNNNNNNNVRRRGRRRKLKQKKRKPKIRKSNKDLITDQQIARWWCGHIKHIREYVKLYTTHTLIELDLYNTKETSNVLYDIFQSSSSTTSQNNNDKDHITYKDVNNDGTTIDLKISKNKSCWGRTNVNENLEKAVAVKILLTKKNGNEEDEDDDDDDDDDETVSENEK